VIISVIVVAYNSAAYLPACIESILPQLRPADELIVVDNGSDDGSADLVRSRYPQARLVHGRNGGYGAGCNAGGACARGDHLVFLNPDTVLRAGALAALVGPIGQGADALTTACVVMMGRPDVINACGNTMHYTGLTYCRGGGRPRAMYSTAAEVDAVSGAAFAIRSATFEQLGGFDEAFFMYVEDTDLSWRARLSGRACLYVPEALIEHDYRQAYTPSKAFYLDRNRHLMLIKNLSSAAYLRLLPGLLLSEIVTWGFLVLKGPRFWNVKPRVYAWLWRQRRAIRASRGAGPIAGPAGGAIDRMTHQLDFGQMVHPLLARAAGAIFHPVFWAARLLLPQPHRTPLRES
jgi:GT2 family glycosyltransferase